MLKIKAVRQSAGTALLHYICCLMEAGWTGHVCARACVCVCVRACVCVRVLEGLKLSVNEPLQSRPVRAHARPMTVCDVSSQNAEATLVYT